MEGTGLHKRGTSAEGWEAADSASVAPILARHGGGSPPRSIRVFSAIRHPLQAKGRPHQGAARSEKPFLAENRANRSGPGSPHASLPHSGDQRRKLPSPRCQTPPPSPLLLRRIKGSLHRNPVPRSKEHSTTQYHQIQPPHAAIFDRRQQTFSLNYREPAGKIESITIARVQSAQPVS